MNVLELYNYKLNRYKEKGKRDNLSNLLALLMLNEKDKYEAFPCSTREFYNRYKDDINKNIEKLEKDFDIADEYIQDLIEENGVTRNDFEYDKTWFIYSKGFSCLQGGINYRKDKTPEELYILCFNNDKDIRLLNGLDNNFNYYNFITLFLANLTIKGENNISVSNLQNELMRFYKDNRYKNLCSNFKKIKQDDREVIDISMMLDLSDSDAYIDVIDDDTYEITMTKIDCYKIIAKYQGAYQGVMNYLTNDYLNNLYNKKHKQYVKK